MKAYLIQAPDKFPNMKQLADFSIAPTKEQCWVNFFTKLNPPENETVKNFKKAGYKVVEIDIQKFNIIK